MKKVKQNLILIIISLAIGFLLGITAILILIPQTKQVISDKPALDESFLGSPTVSGNFVDLNIEDDLLFIHTYDASQRKDVISAVKITEGTIFLESVDGIENTLVFENYFELIEILAEDVSLTIYVEDYLEENPKALMVKINTDSSFIFEPATLDPL